MTPDAAQVAELVARLRAEADDWHPSNTDKIAFLRETASTLLALQAKVNQLEDDALWAIDKRQQEEREAYYLTIEARAEALTARVARLREALREVHAAYVMLENEDALDGIVAIARAALSDDAASAATDHMTGAGEAPTRAKNAQVADVPGGAGEVEG